MSSSSLTIARLGAGWAIKHNGGYLGAVASEDEARRLAERLIAMSREDDRSPGLAVADAGQDTPTRKALASAV